MLYRTRLHACASSTTVLACVQAVTAHPGAVSDASGGSEIDLSADARNALIMLGAALAILAIGSALFFFEALKARRLLQEAIRP